MSDKTIEKLSGDDVKGEDLQCGNVYEITKKLASVKYVNLIGGSTSKGSPIKGGQNGEA